MWCCEGLEYLCEITNIQEDRLAAKLKGEDYKIPFNLEILKFRAMANTQRRYEIYAFETVDIGEQEIRRLFEVNPQSLVDLIRQKGDKIYSDHQRFPDIKFIK